MESDFDQLDLHLVMELTEQAAGRRCSGRCRGLNSYINRVYELEMSEGDSLVAKFYRPGRWTMDAIDEEHEFLCELADSEVPVIAPVIDDHGETLHIHGGMGYALFPKMGGRICDEPSEDEWGQLGRLIGRMHAVGAERDAETRMAMHPEDSCREQLSMILSADLIPEALHKPYAEVVEAMIKETAPLFQGRDVLRIHGDLHNQNIIHRPGEGFHLIDFDDMAMGPAVQDLWMLLPGRPRDCVNELDLLLEGYEMFHQFDPDELRLIEALRAMRFVHFTAWCARQAADGGFSRLAPDWGAAHYWHQEIDALERQLIELRDELEAPPMY